MSFKTLKDKLKSSSFGESLQEKLSSFRKHDSPEPAEEGAHDWKSLRALSGSIHEKLSSLVKSDSPEASDNNTELKDVKVGDENGDSPVLLSSSPALPEEVPLAAVQPVGQAGSPMRVAAGEDVSKEIYEQQLTQLQEQLVAVMIENQNLASQLKVKDDDELKKLRRDLEYERERSAQLARRLNDGFSATTRRRRGSSRGLQQADAVSATADAGPGLPESEQARDGAADAGDKPSGTKRRWGFIERVKDYGRQKLWELLEDLEDVTEPPAPPEATLTVKRLKTNVVRFSGCLAPIIRGFSGKKILFSWQYPMLTAVLFVIYMYVVWQGFLVQTILLMLIVRLLLNYAEEKKVISPIYFLPNNEDKEKKEVEKELGVGEKFNIVLHVATKVQNKLGDAADALEKVDNLLMWRQPELTKQIFLPLCGAFVATLVLSFDKLLLLIGIGLGIKLFVLDNVYNRFPRLRDKYDSSHVLWTNLLSNAELEKHRTRKGIEQHCIPSAGASPLRRNSLPAALDDTISAEDVAFCDRFDLPYTEVPLRQSAFKDGKHCIIFEKDSSLSISSVLSSHAKLVLTQSFLCYERAGGEKKMIALSKITRVEKKKTFSLMPGGGMSLEIAVEGLEKPYVVAGLLNRDECYASLMDIGYEHGLTYASQQWTAARDMRAGEMRLSSLDAVDDPACGSAAAAENAAQYEAFKMA